MTDEGEDDDKSYREYNRVGSRMSGFAAVLTGVIASALIYGTPRMELVAFPIFKAYRIDPSTVARNGQNLCWTREGEKLRNPPLVDIDITVDFVSPVTGKLGHQPTPALFFEATGDDFTTDDVTGPGPFRSRVCVRLAREIKPDQPVQVRQTAYFGSVTGLWTVPFYVPTIVFPRDAVGVFARHDQAPTPDQGDAVAGPKPSAPGRRSDADTLGDVRKGLAEMQRQPEAGASTADRFPVHVDTTLSDDDAARVEQSRQEHGDRSRRDALRRLIPRALDDEDRDALGPYDSGKR